MENREKETVVSAKDISFDLCSYLSRDSIKKNLKKLSDYVKSLKKDN